MDFENCFRGEGCLVQGRTRAGMLSMFLPSRMFTGRCPSDEEMVRIMVGGERFKTAVGLEDDEIRSLATHAVSKILEPNGSPNDFLCIRHQGALPQLLTGHLQALAET